MSKKKDNPARIGFGKFMAWQSRGVSLAANFLVLSYLSIYLSDTMHMDIKLVGTLLLVSKIFDGVTDLFAGYLVDNTNTRWGKARPYEICILGVWLCTWLLFSVPESASTLVKSIWVFLLYTLTNSVFATLLNANGNPYMLRAFKTQEQYVRLSAFGGIVVMLVSIAVSVALPLTITAIATSPAGWKRLVLMYAAPMAIIGIMRFLFVKEDVSVDAKVNEKVKLSEMLLVLKKNKYIYIALGVTFLFQFINGMNVGSYYFTWIIGDLSVFSIFGGLSVMVLPVMLFFPMLSRKFSVGQLMAGGGILGAIGGLIGFFAGTNLPMLLFAAVLTAIATLAPSYMMSLMLLDCGTYNELNGMARMDGTVCAVNNFASKLGSGIGSGLMGIILGAAGYVGSQSVQPDSAILAIRAIYGLVPFISYLTVALLTFRYRLNKTNEELRARQAEALTEEA